MTTEKNQPSPKETAIGIAGLLFVGMLFSGCFLSDGDAAKRSRYAGFDVSDERCSLHGSVSAYQKWYVDRLIKHCPLVAYYPDENDSSNYQIVSMEAMAARLGVLEQYDRHVSFGK